MQLKQHLIKKDLSPRVARWWSYLQDFNFEIVYKKGKYSYIGHVDYLSRNPEIHSKTNTSLDSEKDKTRTEYLNVINSPQSWLEIAQTRDSETQNLIEKVQSGELDENQYIIRNNLLYYKTNPTSKPKLYISKGSRLNILRLFHDENCHVGFDKTYNKILENFWFPKLRRFVAKYLSHSLVCTEKKPITDQNRECYIR